MFTYKYIYFFVSSFVGFHSGDERIPFRTHENDYIECDTGRTLGAGIYIVV